jgi:hypothetical protein
VATDTTTGAEVCAFVHAYPGALRKVIAMVVPAWTQRSAGWGSPIR